MTGAWHSIVVWRLNASLEYVYTCLYWCVFLWAGVSMFWSTVHICKSLYQPQSLLTPHTVSSLTGPPEVEPNERISIRQQWILNCARTDGWISRNGASFQQDLRKCLRKGCSGETGWARAVAQHTAAVLEYYLFNYSKIVMKSLYESSEKYGMRLVALGRFINFLWLAALITLAFMWSQAGEPLNNYITSSRWLSWFPGFL